MNSAHSIQTRLVELTGGDAVKLLTGRLGFFYLKSSENLPPAGALLAYRKKDSIDKIFNSLMNEIGIKTLWVSCIPGDT